MLLAYSSEFSGAIGPDIMGGRSRYTERRLCDRQVPSMTPQILEQRLANIEAELTRITSLLTTPSHPQLHPWWDNVFGVFANCPAFDEVEAFGKAWRKNQPDDIE
jgi:hypothetical protein